MDLNRLVKITFDKPAECNSCGAALEYKGIGRYVCISCGNEMLDDYGKVKEYFRVHGSAPLFGVVRDTGVSKDKVKLILSGDYMDIR